MANDLTTMANQFWRIDYHTEWDEEDACGAEVMNELLHIKCGGVHPISHSSVYLHYDSYNPNDWCEGSGHVFALVKLDKATTESELREHFEEHVLPLVDDDYSADCWLWTYEILNEGEYDELRKRHGHEQW